MQQTIICCLFSIGLFVYSIQLLPFNGSSMDQLFSWSWLLFAILVISGNGLQLLYKRRVKKEVSESVNRAIRNRIKQRG